MTSTLETMETSTYSQTEQSCGVATHTARRMSYTTFNRLASAKLNIEQRELDTIEYLVYSYLKFKIRRTRRWFQKSAEWLSTGREAQKWLPRGRLGHSNISLLGLGPDYIREFAL